MKAAAPKAKILPAALDTVHLLPLREQLEEELTTLGRLAWAEEEFRLLEAAEPAPPRLPSCFDIKGTIRLAPQQLATLQGLLELREEVAAEWDRPPFKVLNNSVLLGWTEEPPDSRSQLLATPGANRGTLNRVAEPALRVLRDSRALPADRCPLPTVNTTFEPMTSSQ
jgi:ribonuclease D